MTITKITNQANHFQTMSNVNRYSPENARMFKEVEYRSTSIGVSKIKFFSVTLLCFQIYTDIIVGNEWIVVVVDWGLTYLLGQFFNYLRRV